MEFSVLDKQTIQCVMTEAEVANYGMDKNAICQNDARTADFFRQIMRQAQHETGFGKRGGNISVHAAFLSDESLEITFFSKGPEGAQQAGAETEAGYFRKPEQKRNQTEQIVSEMETAVMKSKSLVNMIDFCRLAPVGRNASLYVYQGVYFLLADVRDDGVHDTAELFNLADEFVDEICYTKSIAAFIREHGQCMIEGEAFRILAGI